MSENPDVPGTEPIGRGRALVVMPTYNEAGNLASIVPVVLDQDPRIDVLVVDDEPVRLVGNRVVVDHAPGGAVAAQQVGAEVAVEVVVGDLGGDRGAGWHPLRGGRGVARGRDQPVRHTFGCGATLEARPTRSVPHRRPRARGARCGRLLQASRAPGRSGAFRPAGIRALQDTVRCCLASTRAGAGTGPTGRRTPPKAYDGYDSCGAGFEPATADLAVGALPH